MITFITIVYIILICVILSLLIRSLIDGDVDMFGMCFAVGCVVLIVFSAVVSLFEVETTVYKPNCITVITPTKVLLETIPTNDYEVMYFESELKKDFDEWNGKTECWLIVNYNYFKEVISTNLSFDEKE